MLQKGFTSKKPSRYENDDVHIRGEDHDSIRRLKWLEIERDSTKVCKDEARRCMMGLGELISTTASAISRSTYSAIVLAQMVKYS